MTTALYWEAPIEVPLEKWDYKLSTSLSGEAPLEETPCG